MPCAGREHCSISSGYILIWKDLSHHPRDLVLSHDGHSVGSVVSLVVCA